MRLPFVLSSNKDYKSLRLFCLVPSYGYISESRPSGPVNATGLEILVITLYLAVDEASGLSLPFRSDTKNDLSTRSFTFIISPSHRRYARPMMTGQVKFKKANKYFKNYLWKN